MASELVQWMGLEPRVLFAAGSVVAQDKAPASYTAVNGTAVTVTVKGPGTVSLAFAELDAAKRDPTGLVLEGTTAKTQVLIASANPILLRNLSGSAVGKLMAPAANITGAITLAGVGTLTLRDLTAANVQVGSALAGGSYTLGNTLDSKVTFGGAVKSLAVASFQTSDTALETLAVGSVTKLKTGDFRGTLTASGDVGKATLGTVTNSAITLAGKAPVTAASLSIVTLTAPNPSVTTQGINASTIRGTEGVGSVKVAGTIVGTTITSPGSIGAISAGSISASTIAAGVTAVPSVFPTGGTSPFSNESATLKSVTVSKVGTFANSLIVAPTIGKAALGTVTTGNSSKSFGLYGGVIGNTSLVIANDPVTAVKGSKVANVFARADFKIEVV